MFDHFLRQVWAPRTETSGGGGGGGKVQEEHLGDASFEDEDDADDDDDEEDNDADTKKARELAEAAEAKQAARDRRQRELEAELAQERREKAGLLAKLNKDGEGEGKGEPEDEDVTDFSALEGDKLLDELEKPGSGKKLQKFIAVQVAAGVKAAMKGSVSREEVTRIMNGTMAAQRDQAKFQAEFPGLARIYDDLDAEMARDLIKDPRYAAFVAAMNEAPDQSIKSMRMAAKLVMAEHPEKRKMSIAAGLPGAFRGSGAGPDFTEADEDDVSEDAANFAKSMGHSRAELKAFKTGGAAGLAKLRKVK